MKGWWCRKIPGWQLHARCREESVSMAVWFRVWGGGLHWDNDADEVRYLEDSYQCGWRTVLCWNIWEVFKKPIYQQIIRRRRSHIFTLMSFKHLIGQWTTRWILLIWSPEKQEFGARKDSVKLTKLDLGKHQTEQWILVGVNEQWDDFFLLVSYTLLWFFGCCWCFVGSSKK